MVRIASLVALVASVAPFVVAAPHASNGHVDIPMKKRALGTHFTARNVVDGDLARLARFNNKAPSLASRSTTGLAINQGASYVVDIQICQLHYHLMVDTGSSNTWVSIIE